jgi:hypothetical protein
MGVVTLSAGCAKVTPKFCAKIEGIQTIQMSSKVAYYLRFEVHEPEVCHDDKTTGSIGDAT